MSTRQYFGTDGIRGRVGAEKVNPESMLKLGWAVGRVLANGERKKVLIGKDTRLSGYMIESALEAGLSAAGVDILLLGPMPTPAVAYLTETFRASAGIVISASHNPYYDNGIKFFSADGLKLPDDLELVIEAEMAKPMTTVEAAEFGRASRIKDAPGRYIEFCKSTIPVSIRLNGLKIILDCANGATYHIAPNVFRELGADVIETAVTPDGFNINADCGSTQPGNLQKLVLEHQADVGIAFDGDGDRVLMIDHRGEILDGDELLYIMAKERALQHQLSGGIVGTLMSNLGLEQAISAMGIDFVRTKVGDRYVLEALQKHQWSLGGETSGHIICLDKTTTGDGIIAALQILTTMHFFEQSLYDVKQGLTKYPQIMLNVASDKNIDVHHHPKIQSEVKAIETQLNGSGRVVLRPSGTEPVIRVMIEGEDTKQVQQLAHQLVDVVKGVSQCDSSTS